MNRSWTRFCRALLALSLVGTLGFGATQAAAAPDQARFRACKWTPNGPQLDPYCDEQCRAQGWGWGYCNGGMCMCSNLEGPT
jgi:hypothetical protein